MTADESSGNSAALPPRFLETYPALEACPFVRATFLTRVPGVEVATDRATALRRLEAPHRQAAQAAGFTFDRLATAEQVHGANIALVEAPGDFSGVDGLISAQSNLPLGIYVADCGAVYLVDQRTHAIGLVHSGKKGTELGIVPAALAAMAQAFGTRPEDVTLQLAPCIRPPHYEVDFAAEILRSARDLGVKDLHDCGRCTASDATAYYSYRREKGQTGRMLALLEKQS